VTARTWKGASAGWRHRKLQQLGQSGRSSVVHGRAHSHLDSLQIHQPCFVSGAEDDAQELVYFARDLLLDNFGRFFSWADGWSSSTGRSWQTRSLTSKS
jgi:hypothetical protein